MKAWGLIPLAVLGLTACSEKPAAPAQTTAATAEDCPAADFPGFLEAFMADEAVQRRFVRLPLTSLTTLEGAEEGEPISRSQQLTAESLPHPLIMTRREQAGKGVSLNIYEAESANPWIRIANSGAKIRMVYRFERTAGCWNLTVMQDQVLRP